MEKYDKKLSRIIIATGWSQEFLAAKLGVSFVTLNSWINGKSEPRRASREEIDLIFTDVLGADSVNVDELKKIKHSAVNKKYSVKKLLADRKILEQITTSLTYHSNGTEGSTMTEKDVEAVLFENKILRGRTSVEQREAINHQAALYYLIDELATEGANFKLTPEMIKSTHLRMMNGIISDAGYWRSHAVRIRGASVPLANYLKIPDLIGNWCNLVNDETSDKIELLTKAHAEFERIHPFADGNGRTGRLLLFILALKLGLVPPILRKERRFAYYKYLEMAQAREIMEPLEMFIANAIIETSTMVE